MIIKSLISLIILITSLNAITFKVASYNVENLFDLKNDGTEYKEYIPNTKTNWNQLIYKKKLENISKVINNLNSEIISLQEIESKQVLEDLLKYLPRYKYYSFTKNNKSSIGVATISLFPIISTEEISINSKQLYTRPIQKVTINIDNKSLIIFNNHWPSKRASENQRIEYALTLQKSLKALSSNTDYILLGDFNSNYDEYKTFQYDKKLNNTYGITGINQVLNTTIDNKFITKENILNFESIVHYNLWLEQKQENRFSYKYRGENHTPDNILLNGALFDNENISYINNSFDSFNQQYLYKNNKIVRWKTIGKERKHVGIGYSDHLPIFASFSTSSKFINQNTNTKINNISDIYKIENLQNSIELKDVIVLYKSGNNAIIKQKKDKAVFVYKEAKNLKEGYSYDITIEKITTYNGLKEITKIKNFTEKRIVEDYKSLYLNAKHINILDLKYQNEIITNLSGTFKKGYLYFNHQNKEQKIKLYSKDISLLPKNGQNVNIIKAHLGFYKSKVQIIIYNKSDISVN